MARMFDRVGQQTATTGTGTVTLGAAIADHQTFAAAGAVMGDANIPYVIKDGTDWEYGRGTYNSTGPTLSRTLRKSSTGSLLNLSGNAVVYCDPQAEDIISDAAYVGFSASGTWTKQAGLKFILVEIWGGGGGGATAVNGAGGAGGGFSQKKIAASALGATETVTIGAGGTSGGAGGTTSFGAHCSATGGGGSGGSVGAGSGGDLNLNGGAANYGVTGTMVGAGGVAPRSAGTAGGAFAVSAPANSGSGGTSGGTNGSAGYCRVTEFY